MRTCLCIVMLAMLCLQSYGAESNQVAGVETNYPIDEVVKIAGGTLGESIDKYSDLEQTVQKFPFWPHEETYVIVPMVIQENMRGAPIKQKLFRFQKGELSGIILFFPSESFSELNTGLTQAYGQPTKADLDSVEWEGKTNQLRLSSTYGTQISIGRVRQD